MKKLDELLSEIYFHELDTREHIFNRLQLNFAIYASALAVLAYMARTIDNTSNCQVVTLFYVGLFFGIFLIILSIYSSVNTITGFEYKLFPKSLEMIEYGRKNANYAKSLKEYNEINEMNLEIPDHDELTNQYVLESLAICIDHNTKINEFRRKGVRKSVWFMILAAIPIVISATLFIGFDLDASSPRKHTKNINATTDSNAVNEAIATATSHNAQAYKSKEEQTMTSKKATPAPPPPPEKPKIQVSTEDLKGPMPKKGEILNEKK